MPTRVWLIASEQQNIDIHYCPEDFSAKPVLIGPARKPPAGQPVLEEHARAQVAKARLADLKQLWSEAGVEIVPVATNDGVRLVSGDMWAQLIGYAG